MTSFSFKSSGTKFDSRKVQNNDITLQKKPIGIKTPLSFDSNSNTGLFDFHYDSLEQVKDNLKNLVKTNRGERLGRAGYGCNLSSFTFDYARVGDFEKIISGEITRQVEKFLPFVQIDSIRFLDYFSKRNNNLIEKRAGNPLGIYPVLIGISYNVPKIGATNQVLEVLIFVGG